MCSWLLFYLYFNFQRALRHVTIWTVRRKTVRWTAFPRTRANCLRLRSTVVDRERGSGVWLLLINLSRHTHWISRAGFPVLRHSCSQHIFPLCLLQLPPLHYQCSNKQLFFWRTPGPASPSERRMHSETKKTRKTKTMCPLLFTRALIFLLFKNRYK